MRSKTVTLMLILCIDDSQINPKHSLSCNSIGVPSRVLEKRDSNTILVKRSIYSRKKQQICV